MIDIGFSKLALIGIVALVVVGPERLPKVARMAGSLFGRAQRYLNQVKSEVSREIELDELRKMQHDVREAASNFEHTIGQNLAQVENDLYATWQDSSVASVEDTLSLPEFDTLAQKARSFRKKKLVRTTSIPLWYKQRNTHKIRITSAAARVAKYRPRSTTDGKLPNFFC
jgi:sec-independent protein translocase protein TatB